MQTEPNNLDAYCFTKLKGFDAVGFDLDFTLLRYETLNLMKLIHEGMIRFFVHHEGYPKALLDTKYDETISQKNLCIDKTNGLILKLDASLRIIRASFGRRFLDDDEIESIYPNPLSIAPVSDKRFLYFYGPWFLPLITILADYIEISDIRMESTDSSIWKKLSHDAHKAVRTMYFTIDYPNPHIEANFPILEGVDWSKCPPTYFASILGDLGKYFNKCDRLRFIQELRKAGLKTFIVTDSRYEFADVALRFLFGKDYKCLFDIIVTHAMKSRVFWNPNYRFEKVGLVRPDGFFLREEISEEVKLDELKQFHVYGGGNKAGLTEFLATLSPGTSPEDMEILFVGDSMKSDIKSLKKEQKYQWKYAWVQEELESLTWLDHSLVEKNAELSSKTTAWGHMLKAGSGLSYFGADVKRETDFVMSDVLELGGTKNPIRTTDFFESMERI